MGCGSGRGGGEGRTSDANAVDVVWDDTRALDDAVELGAGAVEDDGIEADAVEEAEVDCELVDVVEDGAADLDDGEFCGVGGI